MLRIEDFIRRLPKAELHLHLEGTITPATFQELSARHDAHPLTLAEAEAIYRFDDFTSFIEAFKAVTRRMVTPQDYELVAWHMMQQLAAQGIVHAEVYISVGVIYMWRNFDPHCFEPIFEGLERARVRAACELNLSVYWIFDAVRHFTVEEADRVFRKAAEMRAYHPSIIGIGLGGDERRTASEPFRKFYARAREHGLRLTNHAGETTGPEGIWEALAIGSERIGHALSAIQDQRLMEELKTRGIPLELEPHLQRCAPECARVSLSIRCDPTSMRACWSPLTPGRPRVLRFRPGERVSPGPHPAGDSVQVSCNHLASNSHQGQLPS